MTGYRLYFLDNRGHFQRVVEFDGETDRDAIDIVEQHGRAQDMELWNRARFVRSFPRDPTA